MSNRFCGKVEDFFKRSVACFENRIKILGKKEKGSIGVDDISFQPYELRFLINKYAFLKKTKDFQKFTGLVKRYGLIKKSLGKKYSGLVEENLKNLLKDYAHYLTFPYDLEHHDEEEFQYMLWMRDSIEFALRELKASKKIKQYRPQILVLDKKLKEKIKHSKLLQKCDFDEDYYPKSFWWRHWKETK